MILYPDTSTSLKAAVTATKAALGTAMAPRVPYLLVSSTNCWVKQGTCKLVTCVAKASFADTDYITVTINGVAVVYEFDTAGDGVTSGRVQVNVSTDTTAAQCAARLRTALLANQAVLEVTDNTDGTLTVVAPARIMAITENVANAGFLVAAATVAVSAAAGSMYVPANYPVTLNGDLGPQTGILRDTADGSASLTQVARY